MNIGIIGFGRFGQLWAQLLLPHVDQITVLARTGKEESEFHNLTFGSLEEVVSVDLLFLLVPISEIDAVCKQITNMVSDDTIVLDACSVKCKPVADMTAQFRETQSIIATHPLFGPDSVRRNGAKGQKIVVSDVRSTRAQMRQFEELLEQIDLEVIHATPEEHDQQMAQSQSLIHFIGRGLSDLKLEPQEIATPAYDSLLAMNDMVEHDTWQLFIDMQKYNPYAKDMRKTLISALVKLDEEVGG